MDKTIELRIAPLKTNKLDNKIYYLNNFSVRNSECDLDELIKIPIWQGLKDRNEIKKHSKQCLYYEDYFIDKLGKALNVIHNEKYTSVYWRTMLATWMEYFCRNIYRKYLELKYARSLLGDNICVVAYETDGFDLCRNNLEQSILNLFDIKYNMCLYFILAEFMNFKLEFVSQDCFGLNNRQEKSIIRKNGIKSKIGKCILDPKKYLKIIMAYILNKYFLYNKNKLLNKKNKIVYRIPYWCGSDDVINTFLMYYKSKGKIIPFNVDNNKYDAFCVDTKKRELLERILYQETDDEFSGYLNKLLVYCLPMIFLERYELIKKRIDTLPRPYRLFGITPLTTCEEFTFFAALWQERGVEFLNEQHGIDYGITIPPSGYQEMKLSTKFFSWGSSNKINNIYPMCAFKYGTNFVKLNKNRKVVLYACTDYGLFDIHELSSRYYHYISNIIKLTQLLSLEVSNNYVLRPRNSANDNWDFDNVIKKHIPEVKIDSGERLFAELLPSVKIFVCDNMSTCILQALANNIPTILVLYKEEIGSFLSEEFEDILKKMKNVKMAFDNPIDAAKHINAIYNAVDSWWYSKSVQTVKEEFCNKYARTSNNWLNEWVELLLKE